LDQNRDIVSFIGGDWVGNAAGIGLEVIDPATELAVATLREADAAEVDQAVRAARDAFAYGAWPRMPVAARQDVLRKIHDLVVANAGELARLECLNTGLPIAQLDGLLVPRAAQNFRFFADFIGQAAEELYRQEQGFITLVTREPRGVAALISPWNAPLALSSMKIAGCIAFGSTCVLKPSEQTPLALALLMELMAEAGLPPGVVNMVNGRGGVTGRALVAHPGVDAVSFTGGTPTGRIIMQGAALGPKAVAMELGGKSANIVFADADLGRALDAALISIFGANGEMCLAGSRILLQREIADDFLEAFLVRTRRIRIGDPKEKSTELGPLVTAAHRDRVLAYAGIARAEGAKILYGGERCASQPRGWFVTPTVVLATDNTTRVCQEEIFGPFATFLIFDTEAEAIAIANQSDFGLVAYVWTQDLGRATRAACQIRAGTVWVNTPVMRDLRSAFGGYKQSGFGREGGKGCQALYTEEKTVILGLGDTPIRKLGLPD
jgi:acyl-CoA reductase-like NAD-dependent aldehyde dehydrogenase